MGSCWLTDFCTFSTVTGAATMATTLPEESLTGAAETTERPRAPSKVLVKGLPRAASAYGPMTCLPICRGSLWVRVIPSSLYTMSASTPEAFRASSASGWSFAVGLSLFSASWRPQECAKDSAAASVRCRASVMVSRWAWTTMATIAAATSSTTSTSWRRKTSWATLRVGNEGGMCCGPPAPAGPSSGWSPVPFPAEATP